MKQIRYKLVKQNVKLPKLKDTEFAEATSFDQVKKQETRVKVENNTQKNLNHSRQKQLY